MTAYADLTNLADILKNVYGEGITNQFNDERTTYNLFPRATEGPRGKAMSSASAMRELSRSAPGRNPFPCPIR